MIGARLAELVDAGHAAQAEELVSTFPEDLVNLFALWMDARSDLQSFNNYLDDHTGYDPEDGTYSIAARHEERLWELEEDLDDAREKLLAWCSEGGADA